MEAIRVHELGGPEHLKLEELETTVPGAGEVLVRVEAAGVNFIDIYHRTGIYPRPLPVALGLEGAGVVEAIGPEVTTAVVGTRVAWAGAPGSYATHVVVPADRAVEVPEEVELESAAAAMIQGMTAHYLTRSCYPLGPKDTALVHAAAGGTGLLLCQIARRFGAHVIGTCSTEEKAAAARRAGADEVILYTEVDFESEVKRLTDGRGVQVVYDSVGQDTFDAGLRCLAPRGYMVLFGQSSGLVDPIDPLVLNLGGSLFLTRPTMFHYIITRDDLLARAGEVFDWIGSGELKLTIHGTFPLAEAARAHELLESRQTKGKLLLKP